ncbi:MAG: PEP-CTERM sorting domain-containing protein [Planctomycetaceae bacterium]|nr:PEP-CTERM sorting domain-containing protein [Planctomycetaceae bacterium]
MKHRLTTALAIACIMALVSAAEAETTLQVTPGDWDNGADWSGGAPGGWVSGNVVNVGLVGGNPGTVDSAGGVGLDGSILNVTDGAVVNFNSTGEALYLYSTGAMNIDATSQVNVAGTIVFRANSVSTLAFANAPTGGKVSVSSTGTNLQIGDDSNATLNIGSASSGTDFAGLYLGGGTGVLNIDGATIGFTSVLAIWAGGELNLTNGAVVNAGGNWEEYFYGKATLSGDSQLNFTESPILRFRNNSTNALDFANTPTAGKVSITTGSGISLGDYSGGATLDMTGAVTVSLVTIGQETASVLNFSQIVGQTDGLTTSALDIAAGSAMNLVFDNDTFAYNVFESGGYTVIGKADDWIFRWAGSHVGDINTMINDDRITVSFAGTIPEPATMSLLALGGLAALIRRRK